MDYARKITLVAAIFATLPACWVAGQEPQLTIGLIGDSTVATTYGWGPAFEKRLDDRTKVLHFAKNGATLESLSKKLDELLALKPDYVLVQFGHNDQKKYGTDAYRKKLSSYVERIQKVGARPIVLSSVTRRNFGADSKIEMREEGLKANLASFAKAAKEVAKEHQVSFIDLHTLSVAHHNQLGPTLSATYNFDENDKTHFSPAGAAAIASIIIVQLETVAPEITEHLR